MQTPLFSVVPNCTDPNGNTLALAVDSNNFVYVQILNTADPNQLWIPLYISDSSGSGLQLYNPVNNVVLSASGGDTPVSVQSYSSVSSGTVWTTSGGAIRPQYDSNQNLNVDGDGPYPAYTKVLIWSWGGGQSNEVWSINAISQ